MRQILFEIPLNSVFPVLPNVPIYGYGAMLFLAFVFCTWMGVRLGRREGIPPQFFQDLAVWLFISGIIGARITYMIQYKVRLDEFYKLWDGGLVFYGSAIGALIGYFAVYLIYLQKYRISTWKIIDIVAPCIALGLCLGRIGCLLNGCCFGNVACADCPAIHFPYSGNPTYAMVERGYQTPAGFTIIPQRQVGVIAPGSPAAAAGLKPEDHIIKVGDHEISSYLELETYLRDKWPRSVNDVQLTVRHADNSEEETLPSFRPEGLGLHPTQLYESISMALLLFFLLSYYPLKKHDGVIMVLFMVGYAVHRFLNEMLRTDTKPVAFNMTLSQNISILVLAAAVVLAIVIWVRDRKPAPTPQPVS